MLCPQLCGAEPGSRLVVVNLLSQRPHNFSDVAFITCAGTPSERAGHANARRFLIPP